nr:PREDICTED: neural-cadherin-like isoform X3 [Lepisosteus oculatus]
MMVRRKTVDLSENLTTLMIFIILSVELSNAALTVYYGQVEENAPAGTQVEGLLIPVWKKCPGLIRKSVLDFTLEGENASDFHPDYHGEGRLLLKTTKTLDRELKAVYDLTATPPVSVCSNTTVRIEIKVLDLNDNRPRFIKKSQILEIDELTPIGAELMQLSALDRDSGENGRIAYYAFPPNELLFVVPKNGRVILVKSLIGRKTITLCAFSKDNGNIALQSEPVTFQFKVRRPDVEGNSCEVRKPRAFSEEMFYTVSVSEDVKVGDMIFSVPDLKFEKKWFEVISEADSPVQIERDSGRLYLAQKLKSAADVIIKIQNVEGDDWYLCRLTLTVPSLADLEWTMFPFPYLAAVAPDAAKGTVVYQLSVHHRGSVGSSEAAQFTLIEGSKEYFEVDWDSGEIRTTGWPLTPQSVYVLTVQAVDRLGRRGPYASISILAGFRPPQFTNMSYTVFAPENTAAGQAVAVMKAISFQRKPLSYTLLFNPSSLFSINQESGVLSLTRSVDYESEHHLHHLQVGAMEQGTGLSTVTEVVVHISDENDCTPEFLHSIYSRDNIPETIPPGTSLLQVLARDCDTGQNSEISFFIQSNDFDITPQGVISSRQQLDYERVNHMYEFVVMAVDKGYPSRTGTASVRIRMANVNDEAPVFSQAVYKSFLSEDAGPDTLVAIVHAKDPDGDAVTYAITGGNEDSNFELDSQKGIIKLRKSPSPKLRGPQYILNITATDDNSAGGPQALSSSAQVIVGINDINNNKPIFEECHTYSVNAFVQENQPPGTFVLRVDAYDADTGVNGEVKYGIMHRDGTTSGFVINPDTGDISTAMSFDREKQKEYTLSVTATDMAQEPLIGICQITVMIADENDNDPKFENSRYQYFLREDTPVGTSFLRAAAHDDDQGPNAAITYSLSYQQPAYLHINPNTGWIYVNHPISQTSQISQQIIAKDGGNRSSSVELTVIITNVHNQPPQWEQDQYWVTIPENTVRDTKIVMIKATSPLGDPRVTYNLEEGQVPETNMPVRFYIKPNRQEGSASILVAEPLDYETTRFFTLRVRVQNVAAVPLASFTTVYVNVTDVNDNVPFFMSSTYEATVQEGAEIGTSVAQVSATDLDSGLHGMINYIILKDHSGDSQVFSINPQTGVIYTRASFDREQKSSYLIEVQSQDSSESARPGQRGQPNTDTAYVRVFVMDVNDNAPAFPQSVYEVSVEEDKDVGFIVLTVTANDEDEGANAKLRYQITSGNSKGTFDVEPEVGTIFIAQRLNYEQNQHYELRLVASDGKWENQTLVIINVINQNDEAPIFSQSEYHSSVMEELTKLPVLVLQVSATDPDQEADQSALRYSLHGQGILPTTVLGQVQSPDLDDWNEKVYRFEGKPSRYFILNPNSGQLSIQEGTPSGSYSLQVRVADKTWPDVTSTVEVTVKDLKEEALQNAGSVRITNSTVEEFVSAPEGKESRYFRLKSLLSEIIPADLDNIHIFSVASSRLRPSEVNVWFAAHGSRYYKAEKLNGIVAAYKSKLEAAMGVTILQVGVDECAYSDCSHATGCSSIISFSNTPTALNSGNVSLVSVTASVNTQCTCSARERLPLSCSSYPHGPCLNGGTCIDSDLGYRCKCPPMFDGPECQQTKHTFHGHGYAWFTPIKPCFQSHISLEFITETANGLLFYNGPIAQAQPGDNEDFIALELKNGVPSLSVSYGSGTLQLQLPSTAAVTDRRWHRIDIISDGKSVQLILDRCSGALVNEFEGFVVEVLETDQTLCKATGETPGKERFLDVNQPLQLGGMKESFPFRRTQLHFTGFVGCVRNLIVDSQVYDLGCPAESLNSAPGCALTDGVCLTAGGPSCGIHGKCRGEWGSFSCDCHPGYSGHKCDKALPEWSFEKDSVLRYQLRGGGSARRTHAQLLLRTRTPSGTLLSMTSRDSNEYIVMEMVDGHFGVRANLGDGDHYLQLPALRIDNGQWVLLSLDRHDNVFTLRLDQGGGAREITAMLGHKREIIVHPSSVLLGNNLSDYQHSDFQGCMQDVRLNGHSLPLDGKSTEFHTVLERRGVLPGCHSDACSSKPCRSPLYCVDLWRKHECRCPAGKMTVEDGISGLLHCVPSPCGPSVCRNGGTCVAQSPRSFTCVCMEGYKGQWCEVSLVKAGRMAVLSPSSILAISMCLLVFFAVLVAVTVWNQKGSPSKFQKRGVYHIPAEHESWEDIRENILNYNEEGGGEQDQNAYDITELKRPLCSSLSQSSSGTTAPLLKSSQGSQEEVHPGTMASYHQNATGVASGPTDFKSYVSRIIWEADNDDQSFPMDSFQIYRIEGLDSPVGSLSTLVSEGEEDFTYDCLQEWGSKFEMLSELYRRPEFVLTYRDIMQKENPF